MHRVQLLEERGGRGVAASGGPADQATQRALLHAMGSHGDPRLEHERAMPRPAVGARRGRRPRRVARGVLAGP